MAKRKAGKECVDLRICIDDDTYNEVKKYQGLKMAEGIDYKRWEAASDLFMDLVKSNRDKALK